MRAQHDADCSKRIHVNSALSHRRQFYALFALVFILTGSHAFTTHQSIRISYKRSSTDRMLIAAAVSSSDGKSVARTKSNANNKKRPPPGMQRSNKKYDENMTQAIAINKKLIECGSAEDILSLLAATPGALTKTAGGGALNSVNFSTALHRMARFCSNDRETRRKTLMDPRFALFICSLSEAMAGMDYTISLSDYREAKDKWTNQGTSISFNSRVCSNIAWAIAKIQLAPPASALPIDHTDNQSNAIVETSLKCRSQVLEGARERQQFWIPTLSLLSGRLLDTISYTSKKLESTFNTQESANLLWSLATAQRADKDVFEHISSSLVKELNTQTKPQEFSNSIWAFGKSGIHCKGQKLLLQYTADAFREDPSFVEKWKCNELSNACWGSATILSNKSNRSPEEDSCALVILRIVANELIKRADEFKSQELTNSCWAMATVGFGVSPASQDKNDYTYLKTDDPEGDRELMERALHAVTKSAVPRLQMFRSMELNNLAYAFARLGRTESNDLYAGIAREFCRPRRVVTGQDVGTTLWSFATAMYFDKDAYRAIVSKVNVEAARDYAPTELSNSIYALATAEVEVKYPDSFDTTLVPENLRPSNWKDDPVTVCFAVSARELMRRPHEFKSQEIKDILWSFSKAGVRHPKLFRSVAEYLVGKESDTVPDGQLHCGRGLDDFTQQGIGNLAWSYGKQAQLAAVATVNRVEGVSSVSSGRLFVFTTICMDVGESLIKRLFNCCAETDLAKFDDLAKLIPVDLSNTAWAFSILGLRHTRFFEAMSNQVVQRLPHAAGKYVSFKGQELSNICWASASVNCRFPEMLDAVSTYLCRLCQLPDGSYNARSIAQHCRRQELMNIAWSCAVMKHYPPDLMELLYAGLVGSGEERNAEYLSHVFGDGGLQRQAIMSLLYVQLAIDMEWPDNDLNLPENFPDGWDAVDDNPAESMVSMLSLSTSRIQSDVSSAFSRVGFHHTEEHVITMDELVSNHGIQLTSKRSFEILSIDIADVENKVGIEVDGPGHFVSVLDTCSPQEQNRGFSRLSNGKVEYQFQWDDRQQMSNGSTALKTRLLQGLGWRICHLPFWEWHALKGDKRKEEEYCTKLLGAIE